MNVLFVYPDFMKGAKGKYYEGIASLSAIVKAGGHGVSLFHLTEELTEGEFVDRFEALYADADLIAFSSTTNAFAHVAMYAAAIRKYRNILTACGGLHPTLCPEESIATEGIDIICRGEGEYPLSELCRRIETGEDITDIQSLWIKRGDETIRNDVQPVEENLDLLPMPDRTLIDYINSVDYEWKRIVFMASRGCPFNCTHCCNKNIRGIYPNCSRYVRFKSVDRIIAEIRACLEQWPETEQICFHDDILTLKRDWFQTFSTRYKEEISLPYICNSRFDLMNKDVIKSLKDSGCAGIKFGLESGNDFIRKEILNRNQNREQILNVAAMCRDEGLRLYTFNMVGIPFENLEMALDTVKLNALVKPRDMQVSILYPYPNTRLYDRCKDEQFLTAKTLSSYAEKDSILNLDDFPREEILFAYEHFTAFVGYYRLAFSFPKKMKSLSLKMLDFLWFNPVMYRRTAPVLISLQYLRRILRRLRRKKTNE